MKKNVGGRDRVFRLVIGGVLLLTGLYGYTGAIPLASVYLPQALTAIVLVIIGLALLLTAATRRCMVNKLLDRNTYRFKR